MKPKTRLERLERRENAILDATFKRMSTEDLESFVALPDDQQNADNPTWRRYLEVRAIVEQEMKQ